MHVLAHYAVSIVDAPLSVTSSSRSDPGPPGRPASHNRIARSHLAAISVAMSDATYQPLGSSATIQSLQKGGRIIREHGHHRYRSRRSQLLRPVDTINFRLPLIVGRSCCGPRPCLLLCGESPCRRAFRCHSRGEPWPLLDDGLKAEMRRLARFALLPRSLAAEGVRRRLKRRTRRRRSGWPPQANGSSGVPPNGASTCVIEENR